MSVIFAIELCSPFVVVVVVVDDQGCRSRSKYLLVTRHLPLVVPKSAYAAPSELHNISIAPEGNNSSVLPRTRSAKKWAQFYMFICDKIEVQQF